MFSVVIPLYNKELSIKNTIESVLNQSFQDFEIIIVNDGSTDNSAKIVESMYDDRIRLIHQDNQGVSAARNRGIKESKYEWIAFLDGDDLWEENHLAEIIKMMNIFPDEYVYVTSFEYSDNREMFKHPRQDTIFKIENYFKEALSESLISTDVIVVNILCFSKVGGFNKNLNRGEDLDMWARLAREYDIVKSSELTAIYRIDAENRTSISKDVDKSFVYYFEINDSCGFYEKKYYEYILLSKLYEYLRFCYFSSFIKLKRRYPNVKYKELYLFSIRRIKNRLTFF